MLQRDWAQTEGLGETVCEAGAAGGEGGEVRGADGGGWGGY